MAAQHSVIGHNAPTQDISAHRADFPVLATQMNGKPLAFLDSGASAQKPQIVIDTMNDILTKGYSNIHRGLYSISQDLTRRFEEARETIAAFIGAASDKEIVFTRNTTEAINLVAQSWGRANLQAGDEILISAMEHHANIVPWQLLEDQIGIKLVVAPINAKGELELEAFKELLSSKTKLVSITQISNALGTINPVDDIIKTVRAFNSDIKVLIDGSQGIVHLPVNVTAIDADFYAFTGHKIYGPSGVGVLYGKYDVLQSMPPYQGGGDMIDRVSFAGTTYKDAPFRFEAGTPAIVEVIGLGAAVDYIKDIGMENIAAHEMVLADYAHEALSQIKGLTLHGTAAHKAGIFSFTMDCAHISDIGMVLDQCGVAVRAGHHCCMPLMEELGLEGTVRASLGMYSNKADIDALIAGLNKVNELFGL